MATFKLNGQSGTTQTFVSGATGTDFSISSNGNVHTFNFPSASALNRGLLTTLDWSTFNNKQSALGFTPVSNTTTVNGQALTGNIALTTADIVDSLNKRYVTDAQLTALGGISGTNTGDETAATMKTKLGITTLSGANTGDVTIGTGNGLSLVGQELSLALASGSTTGALSSIDWSTFNNKQTALGYTPLNPANNLSDLASAPAARTNLGLGSLATQNGTFTGTSSGTNTGDQDLSSLLVKANNLSDLTSTSTARTNLGLGTLATQNGTFSGTSSGTNTGDQTNITGNAGTTTALQTGRTINGVTFDGTGNITVPAAAGTLTGTSLAGNVVNSSLTSVGTLTGLTVTNPITGSITGSSGSTAGNATTATALQTARTINGVSFDGTGNITIPAAAGTLTGTSLAAGVTGSSLTSVGTLTGLTVTNPIAGSVTGNAATVTTNANLTGAITSIGNATSLGSFTSAALSGALTDETGSGAVVFANSPVFTTPNIGTATGSVSGNAGTATALQTARTINGVSFDGTASITVPAAAGTLTGTALASNITTSSLTSFGTLSSLALSGAMTGATGYNGLVITPNTGVVTSGTWNGTAVVPQFGGTGLSSLSTYALLAGGTTSTGNVQQISGLGTTGQILTSNGTGALPTWQTSAPGGGANTALSNLSSVAITTALLPNAAGTIDFGSGTLPWKDLYIAGTSGTPGTNNYRITGASTSGTRVITFPNASLTLNAAADISGTTLASNVVSSSITSVGTLTGLTVTNPISGSVTGASGSTTGNAGTATALQTARTINGVSFDGTANITVAAAAGTLIGTTLASGVTASSLTSVGTLSSLALSGAITGATGFNGLVITPNTGAITTGTWNGTTIAVANGGTGTTNGSITGTGALSFTSNTTSALNLDSGTTGAVNLGTGANAKTVTVGNTTGATTLNLQSGTNGIVLEAAGTSTAGTVQIGTTTGKATPDQLVLDSGTADPTGVNGGMYYNTTSGKFRCFENSAWKDCISAGGGSGTGYTIVEKNTDESRTDNTTLTSDSALTFSAAANTAYVVEFIIRYHATNATPDFNYTITGPAGSIFRGIGIAYDASSLTGNVNIDACNIESITTLCEITGTQTPDFLIHITGLMEVQGTAGTVAFQWRQRITGGTTTVDQDSILRYLTLSGASGADLAELYSTNDPRIEVGDVVALDPSLQAGVKKSQLAYDQNAIGIVSTNPGSVIGGVGDEGVKTVPVALAGRVPVKVITENGAVQAGDYLTPSSTPGVAMKSNGAGSVIGQAMSAYNGQGVGLVTVFVKNFDFGGNTLLLGDISPRVNADGSDNGLSTLVATIQSEATRNPVAIITEKISQGTQFLTDFVAARVTAIRGYFDQVFAKQVHTDQLCVKKSDGTEVCVTGDQLDSLLQSNKVAPTTP